MIDIHVELSRTLQRMLPGVTNQHTALIAALLVNEHCCYTSRRSIQAAVRMSLPRRPYRGGAIQRPNVPEQCDSV
uniref:Uncharacterized protein n=1 Tax=Anopheles minimus TaxID=112268 RepID=A0A182W373_9DIPT